MMVNMNEYAAAIMRADNAEMDRDALRKQYAQSDHDLQEAKLEISRLRLALQEIAMHKVTGECGVGCVDSMRDTARGALKCAVVTMATRSTRY
jgi:hypothetical protein